MEFHDFYQKEVNGIELEVLLCLVGCSHVQQLVHWKPLSSTCYLVVTKNHGQALMPTANPKTGLYTYTDNIQWAYEQNKEKFRKDMRHALFVLWSKGYMHEDIYPRNVTWLNNHFTLIDFGKVRKLNEKEKGDCMFVYRLIDDIVERFDRPSVWKI